MGFRWAHCLVDAWRKVNDEMRHCCRSRRPRGRRLRASWVIRPSRRSGGRFVFEETLEVTEARGVAHFPQGLGFDLPDAFAGDFVLAADFLERPLLAVAQTKTQFEDMAFAFGQRRQHL